MASSRNTYISICTRYLFHLPCFSGPFCVGSKRDGYRNDYFSIICVTFLSFWIKRSYLNFLLTIFGSIEELPFPVQEGVREGWEIYQGKEHFTVVRNISLL